MDHYPTVHLKVLVPRWVNRYRNAMSALGPFGPSISDMMLGVANDEMGQEQTDVVQQMRRAKNRCCCQKSVRSSARALGRVKKKLVPKGLRGNAQSLPPCASMIERQMERPKPIPWDFVVKKGSRMRVDVKLGSISTSGILDRDSHARPFVEHRPDRRAVA